MTASPALRAREVVEVPAPLHRWILWHVTGNCNLECDYCYGSFNGGSYKSTFDRRDDVPLDALLRALDGLEETAFTRVHVNGGEPFLRSDIWTFYEALKEKSLEVWTLTNGTLVPPRLSDAIGRGDIDMLAMSIDSIDVRRGDQFREHTTRLLRNLPRFAEMRARLRPDLRLGAYCVLTPYNVALIDDLLRRLVELEWDYFNVQPVFLPEHHELGSICFSRDQLASVDDALERVREYRDRLHTSSDVMMRVAASTLGRRQGDTEAHGCFAAAGQYVFVSSRGDVYGCPSKPVSANRLWGTVRESSLREIVQGAEDLHHPVCPYLSLDCLGMYEMAFMDDYMPREGKQ